VQVTQVLIELKTKLPEHLEQTLVAVHWMQLAIMQLTQALPDGFGL
jgi:hypothetical protein